MAKNQQINQSQEVKKEKSPEMLELEKEIEQLKNNLFTLRNEKAMFDKQKSEIERELKKVRAEKEQQDQKIAKLNKSAFEVREAVRKIDELNLATYSESANQEILKAIQVKSSITQVNSQNDDQILAVAARYKLNDLIFYTADKNLKNKAIAIGVKQYRRKNECNS